jgi:hypothetical protein
MNGIPSGFQQALPRFSTEGKSIDLMNGGMGIFSFSNNQNHGRRFTQK